MNLKRILIIILILLLVIMGTRLMIMLNETIEKNKYFIAYAIDQENCPPCGMTNRFQSGNIFEQEIFLFWGARWDSKNKKAAPYNVCVEIYTRKLYKKLVLKEISYIYEGKKGIITENAEFRLPDIVSTLKENPDSWRSDGNNYWLNGEIFAHPVDSSKGWPKIDFNTLFSNHQKLNEEFAFQLVFIYQFDDEEIKTRTYNYKVTTINALK